MYSVAAVIPMIPTGGIMLFQFKRLLFPVRFVLLRRPLTKHKEETIATNVWTEFEKSVLHI